MTPHHTPRRAFVRAGLLAAALLIGGTPLVASAIGDEAAPAHRPAPVGLGQVTQSAAVDAPQIADLGLQLRDGVTADFEPDPTSMLATSPSATERAQRKALEADGLPVAPPAAPLLPPGPSAEQWAALRDCESGGDYTIASRSGKYRGAYQFDRSTWNSVAERHAPHLVGVDPAAAAPVDQDAMAFALFVERGASPWPHCGRHLG